MDKKERQKLASKKWYEKNKETISLLRKGNRTEEHRKYYLKNKEKIDNKNKLYQLKHREKINENLKIYRKNNPEKRMFWSAKQRAVKKGLEFTIEVADIIIPNKCPLLNLELSTSSNVDTSPSLDRIDNSKGYTKDNIWVISFLANKMKNTATKEELISFATNILKRYSDL